MKPRGDPFLLLTGFEAEWNGCTVPLWPPPISEGFLWVAVGDDNRNTFVRYLFGRYDISSIYFLLRATKDDLLTGLYIFRQRFHIWYNDRRICLLTDGFTPCKLAHITFPENHHVCSIPIIVSAIAGRWHVYPHQSVLLRISYHSVIHEWTILFSSNIDPCNQKLTGRVASD